MLRKNPKTDICETVAGIFHGLRLALEMFRHQPQIVTKRLVALFDVVSNFAAFKRRNRSVRDPSPSHPLPFLQLTNLAVQNSDSDMLLAFSRFPASNKRALSLPRFRL